VIDPQLTIYCPNCREPAEPNGGGHYRCQTYWCRIKFHVTVSMLALALARREARAAAEPRETDHASRDLQRDSRDAREVQARVQPETATASVVLPDSAYYPDRCLAWPPAVWV